MSIVCRTHCKDRVRFLFALCCIVVIVCGHTCTIPRLRWERGSWQVLIRPSYSSVVSMYPQKMLLCYIARVFLTCVVCTGMSSRQRNPSRHHLIMKPVQANPGTFHDIIHNRQSLTTLRKKKVVSS